MNENTTTINWFPGHMAKTKRMMEEQIKLVDLVVELVDARAPLSSKNDYLNELWQRRPRILLLNKQDLADPKETRAWESYFKESYGAVVSLDLVHGNNSQKIKDAAEGLLKEKQEARRKKGMQEKPLRLMITGIPNVGKSTLINQMAKRGEAAKTGNKPGVTRDKQWIRLSGGMLLLDTPGILWPRFDDQEAARRLAFIGCIKEEIMDTYRLSRDLADYLYQEEKDKLLSRYGLADGAALADPDALLLAIGKKRGHIMSGGSVDLERTSRMLLDEFRSGKIGRITLEKREKGE